MFFYLCVLAQKIHASSASYLALMKDNAYELQLRGEIEVKVRSILEIFTLLQSRNGGKEMTRKILYIMVILHLYIIQ